MSFFTDLYSMILDSIYVTLCDQIYLHPISQCCFKFFYYFQRCEGIPLNGEVFAPCGDADRAPSGAGTLQLRPCHANSWSLSWQKRGNEPKPVRRNIIGSWTFIRQSFHMINDVRVGHAVAKLNSTFINDAALVSRNVFPRSNSTFCHQQIALSQWTKQCRAQTLPRRHVGSACNRATNYLKNSFPSPSSSWRWEEKEVHGERGGGDKPSGQYRSRCRESLAKLLCIFGYLWFRDVFSAHKELLWTETDGNSPKMGHSPTWVFNGIFPKLGYVA